MLKRLLSAVVLAASTLVLTGAFTGVVTGTANASVNASIPAACGSARHGAVPSSDGQCVWRGDCYYCYSYRTARWDQQYCEGGSGD
ncbi:hypothetical protein JOL79_21915 [Microbispora sp. RL4-1S]|uniref:Secreted protein n=1 Tax=Microbispora oryzae TaxID=2806554 RepID=A0A940WS61_9ACTN|nr:hypothetical protein [Microbispora oryzae]MBP2706470.1 hypothetical protein [Microbispora oryzae]